MTFSEMLSSTSLNCFVCSCLIGPSVQHTYRIFSNRQGLGYFALSSLMDADDKTAHAQRSIFSLLSVLEASTEQRLHCALIMDHK